MDARLDFAVSELSDTSDSCSVHLLGILLAQNSLSHSHGRDLGQCRVLHALHQHFIDLFCHAFVQHLVCLSNETVFH